MIAVTQPPRRLSKTRMTSVELGKHFPRVKKIWADQGYTGDFVAQVAAYGIDVEIKLRDPTQQGFHVIPWRWVVERTFGWLNLYRRLSKDYEY